MNKLIRFFSFLVFINSYVALGQETTTEPIPAETPKPTLSKQAQKLNEKYLFNGYSLGGIVFSQNYAVTVKAVLDTTTTTTVSSKTAEFQSVGVVGRYSVLPFNSLGTDFGVSLATSVTHTSANLSPTVVLKGEMNLGYAMLTEGKTPYYPLVGFGYEITKGTDIEKIIVPGGGFFQVGGGVAYSKNIMIEGTFSMARHGISTTHFDRVSASQIAKGATTVTFDTANSFATSYVMLGRLIYKF